MQLEWCSDSNPPSALAHDLHLWVFTLSQSTVVNDQLTTYLTAAERQRRDRFQTPLLQQRFTVARARLREILSRYLDVHPSKIEFQYGPYGKPSLIGGDLVFNLSHSKDMAVVAVMAAGAVGVDIECDHRQIDVLPLAKRFFHPAEYQCILAESSPRLQQNAFYQYWTCKEAYLKMEGLGLQRELRQVEIQFKSANNQYLNPTIRGHAGGVGCLAIEQFGSAAYLAYASMQPPERVKLYRWAPPFS